MSASCFKLISDIKPEVKSESARPAVIQAALAKVSPPLLPSLKKMHKSGTNTQMGILRSYGGEYRNFSI